MFSFPKLREYLLQSALSFAQSPSEVKQLITHEIVYVKTHLPKLQLTNYTVLDYFPHCQSEP